jgi:DNA-binding SARP family transcriptional activator/DNA-binding XRE family transcriptional regulator
MIEIRLLGELEVQRDGKTVPLPPSKKTRALLAYLVGSGRPQLRDRLCELLWDGPDDPRAELRWSLTKLRPLMDGCLVADRERVEFRDGSVDLAEFRRLINGNQLQKAAELVRGEFLEGLDLPGCYRFQQWLVAERESLRQTQVKVLAQLIDQLGAGDAGLAHARKRAMLDPFSEDAHIALIRILAALDRNQEALRQYEHCRMLFEQELGRRPSEAVEDARRAVGGGVGRPTAAKTQAYSDEPLIGRRSELDQALAAGDKIVFLTGDPGIGKSRLLTELCRDDGIYGRAFAAEMIRPYGIWIDALAEHGGFPNDTTDRGRLFDRVVELLRNSGRKRIVLDDLQWLDEASAALLHYVSRALRGTPMQMACAARTGELDANDAASRVIRELTRDHRVLQIHLEPLTPAETRKLAQHVGASDEVDRVVAESAGNPFLAIELARASGTSDSTSLDQLLSDRLSQLDPRARELVSWAAAIGRRFDVETLGRATGMAAGEMTAALETLERSAILKASMASSYDFSHDLIRRAAYQKLSGPRKWLVHRQIAQALQTTHDPEAALAGDIVHHASLGGDAHLAATSAIAAGNRCLRLFAYSEGIAVARQGLQIAETLPEDVRIAIQIELLQIIVMTRTSIKDRLAWKPRIEALLEQARTRNMMDESSQGAYLLASLDAEAEDFNSAANRVLQSAELIRQRDPVMAIGQIANTGRCLVFIQRDVPRGRLLLEEAQELATKAGVEHFEIPLGLGYFYAHIGDDAHAIPRLEEAYAMAVRAQDHWREWIAASKLAMMALEREDAAEALRLCQRLAPAAAKMTGGSEGPVTDMLTALARLFSGESADVDRCLQSLRDIDNKGELAYALVFLAERDLRRGDIESARQRAEEALRAAEAVDRRSEAAIARTLLTQITGDRSYLDPAIAARQWDDLTKRAQDRLTEAKHGAHRSRTDLRRSDHIRTAQ